MRHGTSSKYFKFFYKNMLRITCLAHGINRVAEKIREIFPLVNKFVNNGKKFFLKALE